MRSISVSGRTIGDGSPVYFIADIAANHDGSLDRALSLISLAKDAGADCAKFQHFSADRIVSKEGFEAIGTKLAHQVGWTTSVYEAYVKASLPWEWTLALKQHCESVGIDFMSTPYDLESVDHLNPFVEAFKIGSGDIDWLEEINYVSRTGKPVFLATGASSLDEVQKAVGLLVEGKTPTVLMQCNTNYSGHSDNLRHINLRVLSQYRDMFPRFPVGLSDHTEGDTTVLGAVALGAAAIEKHFTDDGSREGPDHGFSMTPVQWERMVSRVRELEHALGDGMKRVQDNENETRVVQRRALRAARDLRPGQRLMRDDVTVLRPAPSGSISPSLLDQVLGSRVTRPLARAQLIEFGDLDL